MIDIKTLATSHDAVITQIGACVFDLFEDYYDVKVWDISWAEQPDRKIDAKTLVWWLAQDQRAISSALKHNGEFVLEGAFLQMYGWMGPSIERIWANDPTFDLAILRNAGFECSFRKESSCRTMFDLSRLLKLPSVHEVSKAEVKHNAGDDALYQAQCMRAIFKDLKALGPNNV